MANRTPLFYTFGNHMHWVDMQWLWGYHVLPGSIRDMLRFCAETGTRGNVNFDGVGYEKLAAEAPDALVELRDAVQAGTVEVVGASYGQPYGGFHGGESNVRHRIYGVRSALRLLGVRPRTFWEEEFDFFPQLPQILKSAGFDGGSLFFQWTWHTPDVPYEDAPVVDWQSPDGSTLRAATRNRLNLHQWPEDVDILMASIADDAKATEGPTPLVLQWLELMPSPDWMCRSEVLLPKTKELLADERFDIRVGTLGEYLKTTAEFAAPVRAYGMDDVFHGMSLGKNGDGFRRLSRETEAGLLTAETFAAIAGLFGRPYAQWDVYPTWELEESWRELLQAQHHDNDECEGLCGHVGRFSYERSLSLSGHVANRTFDRLTQRLDAPEGSLAVFNPLGWEVNATVTHPETGVPVLAAGVPSMGWITLPGNSPESPRGRWTLSANGAIGSLGRTEVEIDGQGQIRQIRTEEWPAGVLDAETPLLRFSAREGGKPVQFSLESMEVDDDTLVIRFHHPKQGGIRVDIRLVAELAAIDVSLAAGSLPRPDGGMNAGIQTEFSISGGLRSLTTDSPYAVHEIRAEGTYKKKYPTGDWMTSDQWFEDVVNPFNSLSLVDLASADAEGGLLIVHDGSQQWFRDGDRVRNLLTMYDPWDEDYWIDRFQISYRLVPHRGLSSAAKWRTAQTFLRPPVVRVKTTGGSGDVPAAFSAVSSTAPNATVTAFYRETLEAGKGLEGYAAREFGADYPYVIRAVEWEGESGDLGLTVAGTTNAIAKTNAMGEIEGEAVALRSYEIATFALDIEEGRKQVRDLDAKRNVWATIHRTD